MKKLKDPTRAHPLSAAAALARGEEVLAAMNDYRVALCLHDMPGSASGPPSIGPFIYVRFHGPQKYGGRYSEATLDRWAEWLAGQHAEGKPVFAISTTIPGDTRRGMRCD